MKKVLSLIIIAVMLLVSCTPNAEQPTTNTPYTTEDSSIIPDTVTSRETIPVITDKPDTTVEETEPVTTSQPETETAEETEPPIVEKRISFMAMGDNIVYGATYRQSLQSDGTYDFKPKYEGIAELISSADIAFVNQETPMCGEKYGYSSYPQFNTPQEMGTNLVELGFDIICFANNHMADKCYESKSSVLDMMDFTDTLDALVLGLHRNEEDYNNIRVYEQDGVKIAFLAYTYATNVFRKVKQPISSNETYFPIYDEETVTNQVQAAKQTADLVFVSIHWGDENRHKPNAEQEKYAQLMADLGVDVIIGHHPHVVQKIEWINGKDGHKTLCYYSLGNSLNAQDYLMNMVGITANFDIVSDENGIYIDNASCTPLFNIQTPLYKNICLILLENLTDDIAASHHCTVKDKKFTVADAKRIITDNIQSEFLPDYLKTQE